MQSLTIEAPSVAAFANALQSLEHETRATVTATERGKPWAVVNIAPATDTRRSVFPLDRHNVRGDTRKRGQSGVMFTARDTSALHTVIQRAARMF